MEMSITDGFELVTVNAIMAWVTYQRLPAEHGEHILQIMLANYLLDDLIINHLVVNSIK